MTPDEANGSDDAAAQEPIDPKERVENLRTAFEGGARALVLTHDNPDPDALAAAFSLSAVLEHLEIVSVVGYAGIIGRAENRAMLRELELTPLRVDSRTLGEFDRIALVDTQPGFGNNSLPGTRVADAVIDHHPRRGSLDGVAHVDIRVNYGTTATIVYEYVQAAGVPLPENLITAIFFAIKSETQELGREAGYADREVYLSLLARADKEAVARIQRAAVPRDYFRVFQVAIENARVYGDTVITDVFEVDSPDMVAEIADLMLRLEGAEWAACLGQHKDAIVLSLRTSKADAHAGEVIRQVVADLGRAGGHGTMAGGRMPLGEHSYDEVVGLVRKGLLAELGGDAASGKRLVGD